MAATVFPALDIKPQPAPDVLGQYARLMELQRQLQLQPLQIQEARNQLAIQNQQVRDIQAGQDAFNQWDGKDYTELSKLIIKNGGSLSTANQIALYGLDRQQKLADIILKRGEAGKNQVETLGKNNDIAAGKIDALMSLPDDQLSQGVLDAAQHGHEQGWLDPSHYQGALALAQQSPQQIRQQLPNIQKQYMSESLQAETALKHAEELEATQRGQLEQQMM